MTNLSVRQRTYILQHRINLDEIAIDPAPFQLVLGTSLYRVSILMSIRLDLQFFFKYQVIKYFSQNLFFIVI